MKIFSAYPMISVPRHGGGSIARSICVLNLFVPSLIGVLLLSGCGSSSGSHNTAPTVVVMPGGASVTEGKTLKITALVYGDKGNGVNWSLSGPGLLSDQTSLTVTYNAPGSVVGNQAAVIVATAVTDPQAVGYTPVTVIPLGTFANLQPVSVNGGPVAGQVYPNGAFTSISVCTPGTLTCNTIDGVLVDTGSVGLRLLSSAVPQLPFLNSKTGSLNECFQFVDQSYLWGQIALADVRLGGEVAPSVPVQVIADPTGFSIPADCTSQGSGTNLDSQQSLGANGILGLGLEPVDCGTACESSTGAAPPTAAYYDCAGTSCNSTFVSAAQQVTHPVTLFATDNNGVGLQFPAVTGQAASLDGTLIFGIGTQINNGIGNATVFTVDSSDSFKTNLSNTNQSLTSSFIGSGSNANFFPDDAIAVCSSSSNAFFCPASPVSISATNIGANNSQNTINFSVENADSLLNGNPSDAVFTTLAGPNGSGGCSSGTGSCSFDWGLPFFFGRSVFTAIDGQPLPLILNLPAAPWWAYTTAFAPQ